MSPYIHEPLARHGTGVASVGRAYLSQVHPVFMLPPVAASLFGAVLAADAAVGVAGAGHGIGVAGTDTGAGDVGFDAVAATAHAVAIFAAVYTAHLKDGYVDFYVRGEDDDHPLTATGCRLGLVASTTVFAAACLVLSLRVNAVAVALTAPTWVIAYLHAPQLDTNPLTATAGYPAGIALAVVGGTYAQATVVPATALAFALILLVLLSGIKVIDDATDYEYDRSIEKRTVAVAVGPRRAEGIATGLLLAALGGVVGFALAGVVPPASALAAVVFLPVLVVARRAPPKLATMLLVRGAYVFLAVLVAAVWFEPLTRL